MKLTKIELNNFRNYQKQTLNFSDGVNVFLGENAQGKTNLLESIYVLALARSHRTANDKELINWQANTAQIKGMVTKQMGTFPLELDLGAKGKIAKVNYLEQAKLSSYIGKLNVILFAPEDLSIVKGSPQIRRKFMDMEFGQMSNQYLYNLTQYRKVLKQRNRYLKDLHNQVNKDRVYLGVLSDQLAKIGAKIIFQRINFIMELESYAQLIHKEISNGTENLILNYKTQLKIENLNQKTEVEIYQVLQASYQENVDKEIYQSTTIIGPHRDDLEFVVNQKDVHSFGSQGQQRTTALAVKLAEIDLMKQQTGEYPILLLDDVLSELDDYRQTHLLTAIQNKVQTFITTTSLSGIQKNLVNNPQIFMVNSGMVTND